MAADNPINRLTDLLAKYKSPDEPLDKSLNKIRQLANSLRDDKTLFYKIPDPHGRLTHKSSYDTLADTLYYLDDSLYRHEIEGLERFEVGSFQFYKAPPGDIYISMEVKLAPEELCEPLFVKDPEDEYEDEDEDEDDLDIFARGDHTPELIDNIINLILFIRNPYPKIIEDYTSTLDDDDTIYLHLIDEVSFKKLNAELIWS